MQRELSRPVSTVVHEDDTARLDPPMIDTRGFAQFLTNTLMLDSLRPMIPMAGAAISPPNDAA
jgi:hypothetical protein